jgi:hypothetical protein
MIIAISSSSVPFFCSAFFSCFLSCFVTVVHAPRRVGRLLLCLSSVHHAWPDDSLSGVFCLPISKNQIRAVFPPARPPTDHGNASRRSQAKRREDTRTARNHRR